MNIIAAAWPLYSGGSRNNIDSHRYTFRKGLSDNGLLPHVPYFAALY